ncbi:MAG TPA: hypothetical protein DCO89_02810 [Clostridiales bacterium]|nr:hypothetical protein [Clostridiales bacterium]
MKKIIFVDFDDTICLHNVHIDIDDRMFLNSNEASEKFYSKSELNQPLYKYLVNENNNGAKIILLTSACSKMLDVKKYWLKTNCPLIEFDDYISASIDINKTQIMLSYAKHNKIDVSNIILIDDSCTERRTAEEGGIFTYNPQLIMNK